MHHIKINLIQPIVIPISVPLVLILLGLVYTAIKPPSPKICGSISAPQVTPPKLKLGDGRNLAYQEFGVPKEEARYNIIVIHGYNTAKHEALALSQVQRLRNFAKRKLWAQSLTTYNLFALLRKPLSTLPHSASLRHSPPTLLALLVFNVAQRQSTRGSFFFSPKLSQ
ncbi:hypothetical protein VNO80_16107 [Phaseolus coccineus]|uniref:Uncharacterized protein n=1 Tax=Phaseolus coccineus TaxID=3886 RepID=A0AAN9MSM9_PHACN